MLHFVFIRHGETAWTKQRRYQGSTDTQLNAIGKKQMQNFVSAIKRYKPHAIFSSSLTRCRESAEILSKPLKKKLVIDARLNEMNFGSWEGKTAHELIAEKSKSYDQWIRGKLMTPQNGESVLSIQKRIQLFTKHCLKKYDNKRIIIVTHGGSIRMFFIELLKFPMRACFQFRIDPGSMTIIGKYQHSTQLILLNSTTPPKGIAPIGCV